MTWEGQGTPWAWRQIRRRVLADADYECQLRYHGICTIDATEVHHLQSIKAAGISRREALDPDDCIAVCTECHKVETQRQSAEARRRNRNKRYRRPVHPADVAHNPSRGRPSAPRVPPVIESKQSKRTPRDANNGCYAIP